jgi:transcriptional regulator with XRE-family HTH domain
MKRERLSKRPLPPRKLASECPCCGEANPWVLTKVDFTAPFRDTEHVVRAQVNQCRHCDAITTSEDQSAAIATQVREAHRKWISERLKKAQKELGLSLRELSEKADIPFATLGRISAGEHYIEATSEKLLWLEIEKLTHEHRSACWIQMAGHSLRVTNGRIVIRPVPGNGGRYTRILQTPMKATLDARCDAPQAEESAKQFCSQLLAAYA